MFRSSANLLLQGPGNPENGASGNQIRRDGPEPTNEPPNFHQTSNPAFMMAPNMGDEYRRLQGDFFKWQDQLMQNQSLLHSRVVPLTHSFQQQTMNPNQGPAQPKVVNIPIVLEDQPSQDTKPAEYKNQQDAQQSWIAQQQERLRIQYQAEQEQKRKQFEQEQMEQARLRQIQQHQEEQNRLRQIQQEQERQKLIQMQREEEQRRWQENQQKEYEKQRLRQMQEEQERLRLIQQDEERQRMRLIQQEQEHQKQMPMYHAQQEEPVNGFKADKEFIAQPANITLQNLLPTSHTTPNRLNTPNITNSQFSARTFNQNYPTPTSSNLSSHPNVYNQPILDQNQSYLQHPTYSVQPSDEPKAVIKSVSPSQISSSHISSPAPWRNPISNIVNPIQPVGDGYSVPLVSSKLVSAAAAENNFKQSQNLNDANSPSGGISPMNNVHSPVRYNPVSSNTEFTGEDVPKGSNFGLKLKPSPPKEVQVEPELTPEFVQLKLRPSPPKKTEVPSDSNVFIPYPSENIPSPISGNESVDNVGKKVGPPPPPPPPPPPGPKIPGPPIPPADPNRTSTGKIIVPSNKPAELDPRDELMMAIRSFGGTHSGKLRRSGRRPKMGGLE